MNRLFERNENVESISNIVEQNPGLCEERDFRGELPLFSAVHYKSPLPVLEYLVSVYPEARSIAEKCGGQTPLHIASRGDQDHHQEVYQLLATPEAARMPDRACYLPLTRYCDTTRQSTLDTEVIRILVDAYPTGLKLTDSIGRTPLHWAVADPIPANVPAIRSLIEAYPAAAGMSTNNDGATPLLELCTRRYRNAVPVSCVRLLLKASPNSVKATDRERDSRLRTPLEQLCEHADEASLPAIECLFNAYPEASTIRDHKGCTLLHRAVCSRPRFHKEVVRFLVSKCTALLERNDTRECGTPLHHLCMHGHSLAAEYLSILAISEAAVTAKNGLGRTPLHVLSYRGGSRDLLQFLLEKSPRVATMKDGGGRVALHLAVMGLSSASPRKQALWKTSYHETVECLLDASAGAVGTKDIAGLTPLDLACERNVSLSAIYQLVRVDPIANLCLESRAGNDETGSRKRKRT